MKSIYAITLLVAASLTFVACKGETKKVENTVPNVPTVRANGLKIAFYNQDSLTKYFEYYVEMDSMMKSKQLRFQGELQKREKALQGYVMKNEELAKAGSLSAFEIQSIQEEAQRRQQALMQYQESEGMKLEKETGELLSVISKKIEQAGKKYSQKHGLDILMMHGAAGQFVYVNPTMDVTKEFIAYLNQHQAEIEADMGKTKK